MDKKSSVANQFTGLPLKFLIGAPLVAAADANALLSKTQTAFIIDNCFERNSDGKGSLRPITVGLTLQRQQIGQDGAMTGNPLNMNLEVPLLTLMPINQLAVHKLDIAFDMEVKSASDSGTDTGPEMHGQVASRDGANKSGASSTAKYEVRLEAGNLPLPKGLVSIIESFSQCIAPMASKSGSNS